MKSQIISVELDGRKVLIDQAAQEVSVLDENGRVLSRERIQVAAASLAGNFTPLKELTDITTLGSPRHNA